MSSTLGLVVIYTAGTTTTSSSSSTTSSSVDLQSLSTFVKGQMLFSYFLERFRNPANFMNKKGLIVHLSSELLKNGIIYDYDEETDSFSLASEEFKEFLNSLRKANIPTIFVLEIPTTVVDEETGQTEVIDDKGFRIFNIYLQSLGFLTLFKVPTEVSYENLSNEETLSVIKEQIEQILTVYPSIMKKLEESLNTGSSSSETSTTDTNTTTTNSSSNNISLVYLLTTIGQGGFFGCYLSGITNSIDENSETTIDDIVSTYSSFVIDYLRSEKKLDFISALLNPAQYPLLSTKYSSEFFDELTIYSPDTFESETQLEDYFLTEHKEIETDVNLSVNQIVVSLPVIPEAEALNSLVENREKVLTEMKFGYFEFKDTVISSTEDFVKLKTFVEKFFETSSTATTVSDSTTTTTETETGITALSEDDVIALITSLT